MHRALIFSAPLCNVLRHTVLLDSQPTKNKQIKQTNKTKQKTKKKKQMYEITYSVDEADAVGFENCLPTSGAEYLFLSFQYKLNMSGC